MSYVQELCMCVYNIQLATYVVALDYGSELVLLIHNKIN